VSIDYPDFATPQAHADRIAVTGAPLLNLAKVIDAQTFTLNVIPSSQTFGPFAIGQISYELYVACQDTGVAGSASFLILESQFTDSATGLILSRRKYKMVTGPAGTDHKVMIRGPMHADQIKLIWSVPADSVAGVTVTYRLLSSSRVYVRDVARTTTFAQDGFTSGGAVPELGVMGNTKPLVGNGGALSRLIALYNGDAVLTAQTTSLTSDATITVQEAAGANPLLANQNVIFKGNTDALGNLVAEFTFPGVQAIVTAFNGNVAPLSIGVLVTMINPGN